LTNLASAYRDLGRVDEALPLYGEALQRQKETLGADHPQTLITMNELAEAHLKAGHASKALPLLEEQFRRSKAKLGLDHPSTLTVMADLIRVHLTTNPAEAETLGRQLLAIRQKQFPDDWRTFQTQSLLGFSLLRQKRYAEAEALLTQGYEGMRTRELKIPVKFKHRLREARDRLDQFYREGGKSTGTGPLSFGESQRSPDPVLHP
jgi:non-specific serine/threonine protein kinase